MRSDSCLLKSTTRIQLDCFIGQWRLKLNFHSFTYVISLYSYKTTTDFELSVFFLSLLSSFTNITFYQYIKRGSLYFSLSLSSRSFSTQLILKNLWRTSRFQFLLMMYYTHWMSETFLSQSIHYIRMGLKFLAKVFDNTTSSRLSTSL